MQLAQIALRMLPESLICHWQWTQQQLHCSQQCLQDLHNINWQPNKAGVPGEQLRDVVLFCSCSVQEFDPRCDTSCWHFGSEVCYLSQL